MQDVPPPVKLYFGRNGFKHASSSNIYDWVTKVDNNRQVYVESTDLMDTQADTITPEQKRWVRTRRELRGVRFKHPGENFLRDYDETSVLVNKLR